MLYSGEDFLRACTPQLTVGVQQEKVLIERRQHGRVDMARFPGGLCCCSHAYRVGGTGGNGDSGVRKAHTQPTETRK